MALLLALALQESTLEALTFLARHQLHDGSWGSEPDACRCARPEPPSSPDASPIEMLVRRLGDADPAVRDAAAGSLRSRMEEALPRIRAAVDDPDPEIAGRCRDLAIGARRRMARGAGDLELTGLATLAFLWVGFSPLAQDTLDGIAVGRTVDAAVRWLLSRQDEEGFFDRKDAATNAIAACAVLEVFNLTGQNRYLEAAASAGMAVARSRPGDDKAWIWRLRVLQGTRTPGVSLGVHVDEAVRIGTALRQAGGARGESGAALAAAWFGGVKMDPVFERRLLGIDPLFVDPSTLLDVATAVHWASSSGRSVHAPWGARARDALLRLQERTDRCERGSWEGAGLRGRLEATACLLLVTDPCHGHCCRNVFSR